MRAWRRSAKSALKRILLRYLRLTDQLAGHVPATLFICGHMRSGSTLLHHLLISHPEIIGCGERQEKYASAEDFDQLRIEAHMRRLSFLRRYRYVSDQVNHNELFQSPDILNEDSVRAIFLIRQPQPAVASMVAVLGRPGRARPITREMAVAHYRARLDTLSRYARQIERRTRAFTLTYDELVDDTLRTLGRLTAFLQLRSPLTDHYRTFDFTGIRGDPSPAILARRIRRGEPRPSPPGLEATLLAELDEAYESCRQVLLRHCTS